MKSERQHEKIALVGGGRWARVLLQVFLAQTNSNVQFTVHTQNLSSDMRKWAKNSLFRNRVLITETEPDFLGSKYIAAIVANALDGHKSSAERALLAKVPVLVEKPMAPSFEDTVELIKTAKDNDTFLSLSRVFLYTRYLDNFVYRLANIGSIKSLRIEWTDKLVESRYGEIKSFDHATPVFKDVLPHICCILFKIFQDHTVELKSCTVSRGGCFVEITMIISNVECCIVLERNSDRRRRRIIVHGQKECMIDFSVEPGMIFFDGTTQCADPYWDTSPSPLDKMAAEFLKEVKLGNIYQDCSVKLALATSKLVDEIEPKYLKSLDQWLANQLYQKEIDKTDLHYFLSELVRGTLKVSYDNSEEIILRYLDIICSGQLLKDFEEKKMGNSGESIIEFIKSLEVRV